MSPSRLLLRWLAWLREQRERWRGRWLEWRVRRLLRRTPALLCDLSPAAIALQRQFVALSVNRAHLLRLQHDREMLPRALQQLLLAWLASGAPCPALANLLTETCTDAPTLLVDPVAYCDPVVMDLGPLRLNWYQHPSAHHPSGPSPPRRLVVAVASNANAVAMIGPCFLQLLGPFATDVVLVLRDRPQHRSFYGPTGDASLLALLLRSLPALVPLSTYQEVVTLGYSGGGFAAAVAAVALGADRGVSISGWPPQGAVPIDRTWIEALRATLPAPRSARPRLLLCCAAGCRSDREGTARAAALAVGWQLPLAGVETRAYQGCRDHNLLVELQRRRFALHPVLADLLFPLPPIRWPKVPLSRRARWRTLSPA